MGDVKGNRTVMEKKVVLLRQAIIYCKAVSDHFELTCGLHTNMRRHVTQKVADEQDIRLRQC
jgi:hypothetical protein